MQVKEQQLKPDMKQQTGFKLGKEYVKALYCQFSSVAQSCSILCDPVDFSTPGFPVNSRSLLKLMPIELVMPPNHLILWVPFSSYLQSFPASESFQMSQFFASGAQSIGVSASASVIYTKHIYKCSNMYKQVTLNQDFAPWRIFDNIGEGNGNPLQCSCLENPRDGGAWWAVIYGVAQSRTRLKWLSSSSNTYV